MRKMIARMKKKQEIKTRFTFKIYNDEDREGFTEFIMLSTEKYKDFMSKDWKGLLTDLFHNAKVLNKENENEDNV